MTMIGETRKVKKYNLTPQGKPLHEDESRFGMKMLKSMGWSVGKGLGREEDGATDILKVRCKNNVEGLGFVDRNDQWTEHTEAFDSLLSSLNSDNKSLNVEVSLNNSLGGSENADSANEARGEILKNKISGISLEKISKNSKVRVHYKKFTKSKDLAQYSEKDLANIFGKKHSGSQSAICLSNNEAAKENTEGISSPLSFVAESPTTSFIQKTNESNLSNSSQSDEGINSNDCNAILLREDRNNKDKPDVNLSTLAQEDNLNNSVISRNLRKEHPTDSVDDDKNRMEIKKKKKKKRHAEDLLQNVDQDQTTILKKCDALGNETDNTTITESNKTADKSAEYMCPVLQSLQSKLDSLNVYTISSFCAEKFSNVDFEGFRGSSLEQIEGYTIDSNTRLHVVNNLQSDPRTINMWKYDEDEIAPTFDKSRKSYKNYLFNAIHSRRNNELKPKLPVKDWKKKNAFSLV